MTKDELMNDTSRITNSPFNVARFASNHVSSAVKIASELPEDADEAQAILADAARFYAVIRDRKTSAIFANALSKLPEKDVDAPGVR